MTFNTFSSGINTSFTSELNANFADCRQLVTRTYTNTVISTASTSTTWTDVLTLTTPSAPKGSQVVFIDAQAMCKMTDGGLMSLRLYDDSTSTDITLDTDFDAQFEADGGAIEFCLRFIQGTTMLTNSSDTKSIKLQAARGSGGDAESQAVTSAKMTATLVES